MSRDIGVCVNMKEKEEKREKVKEKKEEKKEKRKVEVEQDNDANFSSLSLPPSLLQVEATAEWVSLSLILLSIILCFTFINGSYDYSRLGLGVVVGFLGRQLRRSLQDAEQDRINSLKAKNKEE